MITCQGKDFREAVASAYGLNPDEEAFLANLQKAITTDPERWQATMTALYLSAAFPLGSLFCWIR